MDDLSLRVYLENGSDAMRGGWLELPVVPERLDAFMRGVVGVDSGRSIRCRIHGARAIPLRMSCTARMSRTG